MTEHYNDRTKIKIYISAQTKRNKIKFINKSSDMTDLIPKRAAAADPR